MKRTYIRIWLLAAIACCIGFSVFGQADNEQTTAGQAQSTGDTQPVTPEYKELQDLSTRLEMEQDRISNILQNLEKDIAAAKQEKKATKDAEKQTALEHRLYVLQEMATGFPYLLSLLQKEIDLQKQIMQLEKQPPTQQTEQEVPATAEAARQAVNRLTLIKNETERLAGNITSHKAEQEVKQARLQRLEEESPADDSNTWAKQLHQLKLDTLNQELRVIARQLLLEERKQQRKTQEQKDLQALVDAIDPALLVSSDESMARKQRQAERIRRTEDQRKQRLIRERKQIDKQLKQVEGELAGIAEQEAESTASVQDKHVRAARKQALEQEKQMLQRSKKLLNWQQQYSKTKVELENRQVRREALKKEISRLRENDPQRRELEDELVRFQQELTKQVAFYQSKSQLVQKEIEAGYIALDQHLEQVDALKLRLEKEETSAQKNALAQLLKQEEYINREIQLNEQLKELMDRFVFLYQLNETKWQEVARLLPQGPKWFRGHILGSDITVLQVMYFFLAVVLIFLLSKAFHYFTQTRLKRWVTNESLLNIFEKPIRFLIIIIGLHTAIGILSLSPELTGIIRKIFDALIIVAVSYLVVKCVDFLVSLLIPLVEKTETKLDDQLIPIIRKAAKVVIFTISAVILIERMGYPVTSIIAGLGIGGLAFALAAKDTVANLFGSVVIFLDRPFQIGDWVNIDASEGIIEEVGVRSTKIRTFADTLITIPNSVVANATIKNISAFRNRRVLLQIGITYSSGPQGAEKAVAIIRDILDTHEKVKDGHYIYFDDFKDSSLNIMVYYFVGTTVWREYLEVRSQVNLEIMRRFAAQGIQFAFPTHTIEFSQAIPALGQAGTS